MDKMGLPQIKKDAHYTYGDYLSWPEEERWELIHGIAYNMSPAPSRRHQSVSAVLLSEIHQYLKGKKCKVYAAPFDVLFPEGSEETAEIDTVVQPDIVVYCDSEKLTKAGATGSPTIAVEILSPYTSRKDLSIKYELYEKHGVKEYWVIDPLGQWLTKYTLMEDGKFDEGQLIEESGRLTSDLLNGFELDIAVLFE